MPTPSEAAASPGATTAPGRTSTSRTDRAQPADDTRSADDARPADPDRPTGRTRRFRPGLTWVALSSVAMAAILLTSYTGATLDELAQDDTGLASTFANRPPAIQLAFYLHIAFAGIALLVGPLQFVSRWRRRAPRLHRVLGRVYLVGVGVGALTGLVISTASSVAFLGFFGFGTLAVLWAWTGWKAYRAIRAGRVAEHQAWMIRCFALTYAAVTLRLWVGVLVAVQTPFAGPDADPGVLFETAYAPVAFLCWLPNVVIAECLIARRNLPGLRMTSPVAVRAAHGTCRCRARRATRW
jgi:uncharacterized membrane protein